MIEAEAVGGLAEPTAEEKTWGMLAHLLGFAGWIVPLGSLVAPVVVGVVKKESVYVRRHAWASLNFQLSLAVHAVIAAGLFMAVWISGDGTGLRAIGLVLVLLYALGIGIGSVVLMVLAGLRAHQGRYFRYPWTIRFVNDKRMGP